MQRKRKGWTDQLENRRMFKSKKNRKPDDLYTLDRSESDGDLHRFGHGNESNPQHSVGAVEDDLTGGGGGRIFGREDVVVAEFAELKSGEGDGISEICESLAIRSKNCWSAMRGSLIRWTSVDTTHVLDKRLRLDFLDRLGRNGLAREIERHR